MKKYLTTKTFFAAILVAGIFAISQIPSNAAMADGNNAQIPSSVTIPLEGLTLKAGQLIELIDTTPVLVTAAHAVINVPCDNGNNNNDPESHIAVVAGVAPDLESIELEYIAELSDPEDNCLYHADIPENEDDEVTDIIIINNGDETVKFGSGNFASASVTEVSD
jgi:hypothetical protein